MADVLRSLGHPGRQAREQAVGARKTLMLTTTDQRNGSVQDNNGCRWEWKFSLDSDRRPELWCRCQTCGVKYYLSSWQWTLDSDRNGKCVPPTGKHFVSAPSESGGASVQAAGSIAPPAGASANGGTGKMRAAPRASSELRSARPNGCRRNWL